MTLSSDVGWEERTRDGGGRQVCLEKSLSQSGYFNASGNVGRAPMSIWEVCKDEAIRGVRILTLLIQNSCKNFERFGD
jgi:hypothetical protein